MGKAQLSFGVYKQQIMYNSWQKKWIKKAQIGN